MACVGRLQDEHRLGLAIGAQSGQVGESGVRPEPEVGVVGADLQPAGGDHQSLAGKGGADPGAPTRRPGRTAGSGVGRSAANGAQPVPMNARKASENVDCLLGDSEPDVRSCSHSYTPVRMSSLARGSGPPGQGAERENPYPVARRADAPAVERDVRQAQGTDFPGRAAVRRCRTRR